MRESVREARYLFSRFSSLSPGLYLLRHSFQQLCGGWPAAVFQLPARRTGQVTICHAAGLAGTTHFETISIAFAALPLRQQRHNSRATRRPLRSLHRGRLSETPTATSGAHDQIRHVATNTSTVEATSTDTPVYRHQRLRHGDSNGTTETTEAAAVVPTDTPAPLVTVVPCPGRAPSRRSPVLRNYPPQDHAIRRHQLDHGPRVGLIASAAPPPLPALIRR
jgi:hypothetical protein